MKLFSWWFLTSFLCIIGWLLVEKCSSTSTLDKGIILMSQQKGILERFKRRMSSRLPHDYMKQDIYMVRWLKAQNFNLVLAEWMLLNNLQWRRLNKVDTILEEDWSDMRKKYPYFLDTVAKDGNPILTGNFGEWNIRESVISGELPRMSRYIASLWEDTATTIRRMQDDGKNVKKMSPILKSN